MYACMRVCGVYATTSLEHRYMYNVHVFSSDSHINECSRVRHPFLAICVVGSFAAVHNNDCSCMYVSVYDISARITSVIFDGGVGG